MPLLLDDSTWRRPLRMPLLLDDFTHARTCKPFCEKYLTLPVWLFKKQTGKHEIHNLFHVSCHLAAVF